MPDQRIIEAFQAAYDWIFDRTGLYKGQVFQLYTIFYIGIRAIYFPIGLFWMILFCLGCMTIASFWNHAQKHRNYTAINIIAERSQTSSVQSILRMTFVIVCFIPSNEAPYTQIFMFGILLTLLIYLSCVKVRDREPPETLDAAFNRG